MRRRRSLEIIAGRVNADGSIATGDGFTISKTVTGNYVIGLPRGFRPVAATGSTIGGGVSVVFPAPTSDGAITAIPVTTAGVATDNAFHFIIAGVQQ